MSRTPIITDLTPFPNLAKLNWAALGDLPVEVWYAKRLGDTPATAEELATTHVHLLTIHQPSKERIYAALQGERWSPNGEARPFLEAAGLWHTSMSTSDILVIQDLRKPGIKKVMVCAALGWEEIPPAASARPTAQPAQAEATA
ncbi:MAG: hypothetical protein Q8N51_09710 [Gammaproteobacteria bacterium]|nr:hypothetical protein [Gammaproteobacteria bacterium]